MSTTAPSAAAEWLTAGESAALLCCSPKTVYRLADSGQLPGATAIGNGKVRRTGFRVPRTSVEQHIANSAFAPAVA
jgi:excisionase family DNA binding protein